MRFPLRALVLLGVASFCAGRAVAGVMGQPITITGNVPSAVVNSATGEITIGSSEAAGSVAARAAGSARAITVASGGLAESGAIGAVVDEAVIAGPAGALGVEITSGVEAAGAAEAILACIASVVCAAAGVAIAGIGAAVHAYCADGACKLDKGEPGVMAGTYIVEDAWHDSGSTADEACAGYYARLPQGFSGIGGGGGSCAYKDSDRTYPGPNVTNHQAPQCPVVNGVQPQGWSDGAGGLVCPSQGMNLDPDPEALVKATKDFVTANPGNGVAAVTDAVAAGTPLAVSPYSITGPATQQGTTTTTTQVAPDGTSTATQVATTYGYTYAPAAIEVSTTTATTTTTTNRDGTTSTVTDTKTVGGNAPSGGTSGGTSGSTDTPDLCALHPDVLACAKIGDPPTDEVPKSTQSLPTYIPEVLGLPAACPAPIVVAGHTIAYDGICSAATQAAPFIRVGGALVAMLMVIAAVRSM